MVFTSYVRWNTHWPTVHKLLYIIHTSNSLLIRHCPLMWGLLIKWLLIWFQGSGLMEGNYWNDKQSLEIYYGGRHVTVGDRRYLILWSQVWLWVYIWINCMDTLYVYIVRLYCLVMWGCLLCGFIENRKCVCLSITDRESRWRALSFLVISDVIILYFLGNELTSSGLLVLWIFCGYMVYMDYLWINGVFGLFVDKWCASGCMVYSYY